MLLGIKLDNKVVEIRNLSRPFFGRLNRCFQMHLVYAVFGNKLCLSDRSFLAVSFDISGNLCFFILCMIVVDLNFKLNVRVIVVLVKVCCDKEVTQANLWLCEDVNLSVNTAEQPHILILNVLSVAVTVNLCGNGVLTRYKIFRNVKFVRRHSTLRIADKTAVYINLDCGFNCAEIEKNFLVREILGQVKLSSVNSDFLHIVVD